MNSTEAIAAVRRSAQLSDNDPTYTDSVILDELSEALIDRFAAPIKSIRQGYWKQYIVRTCTVNEPFVLIPHRSIAQGTELVEISTDGGTSYTPLSILTDTQAQGANNQSPGTPHSYWLETSGIHLVPAPSSAFLVRMRYLLRPPRLVTYAATPAVVSVDASTYSIVVNANPALTVAVNGFADLQRPNGSHEITWADARVESYSGVGPYVVTFYTGTDLTKVSAGDLFTLTDTAKFPMLPREMHRPLCDYTGAMILVSKGDVDKASILSQKADAGLKRVVDMMSPRVGNSPFVWVNTNSYLRRRLRSL